MTSHTRNAFLFATIVAVGGFLFGLDAALISGAADSIAEQYTLSSIQKGTAVSAPALGVLIALPFAGYISNRYGRKKTLLLIALLYLASAIGSTFAPSFEILVVSRFLGGLAFSSIALASMYIGEIAPPNWRGKLVSMTQINIVIGLSGAYFLNYLIHDWATSGARWAEAIGMDQFTWRWMLGSEIPFALLWLVLLLFIPESPAWLVCRNRDDDAERTLQKLMPEHTIAHHMDEMRESLRRSSDGHSLVSQFKEIFSKPMRLTFVIALTIAIAQQSSGINAILFYAQTVFQQLGIGTNAAFAQAVWIGLTSIVFTVLGLLLVDRLGRRPLIIGGMIWIIASHAVCSYGFRNARYVLTEETVAKLTEIDDARNRLRPLIGVEFESDVAFNRAIQDAIGPAEAQRHQSVLLEGAIRMNATLVLVGILSFIGAFHFSVGPVMWVLFSEIFPISVRAIAIPFFTIITSLTNYLVQQFFPWQLENIGMAATFLFYSATVTAGLMILFFTLIETKNMSIEDIQIALSYGSK